MNVLFTDDRWSDGPDPSTMTIEEDDKGVLHCRITSGENDRGNCNTCTPIDSRFLAPVGSDPLPPAEECDYLCKGLSEIGVPDDIVERIRKQMTSV